MAMTFATDAVRLLGATDALSAGPSAIGGKAFGLARLAAIGLRVPSWFVIPAPVFRDQLRRAELDGRVHDLLQQLEVSDEPTARARLGNLSLELRALVAHLDIDEDLRRAIDDMRAGLGPGQLAVRSSAIDEDGERHSFAGQLDTVLGIDDSGALIDAIRCCWASAFGERVLDYRWRTGTLRGAADVAVIVQPLIRGDVSGVLFTVDPLTGDRGRVRISACAGLGEALVSGELNADEYVLDRQGCALASRTIGRSPLLDAQTLAALVRAGLRIESSEGAPRDIEWTIAGGEIWVLQSRPITSTGAQPRRGSALPTSSPATVWDNSNIQESYCGVTTPLTFSFAQAAYASVYEQTMRAVGIPERIIERHRPLLRNLLGLIHGRVYYNLNNWYRGLLLLPAFRRNKADMERMMGVDEPVDFVADEHPSITARLGRLPRLVATLARLAARFARLERDTARFLARFDSTMSSIDRAALAQQSFPEFMGVLHTLQRDCLDRWTTPIINDFYVMMTVGRLRRLVERAANDDVDRAMQTLLGGADVATSAAPALLMLSMANAARREPRAFTALRDLEGEAALRRARDASETFRRAHQELIERFGDRCMGELKLESRPLRDDPAFIVRALRNYLHGAVVDPRALAERGRAERELLERELSRRMKAPIGRWRFRRTLVSARRAIRARESMRLARTRLFGAYRDTYRAIGAHLQAAGRLDAIDDILYLTVGEIDAYWRGTAVSLDLRSLVRLRRREFASFESREAPNRIVTIGEPYAHASALPQSEVDTDPVDASATTLRGLGASPGIVEGRVRIVTGPTDDLSIAGCVLVATRTDPGWAPLFPGAAAIVVERGSILSHSAVLARELGLPAVVAIPNLLRTLRDGERVRVDGAAGTIVRLEEPCAS